MKTYSAKPNDVTRSWYEVDASDTNLGRLATQVATLLNGKQKPTFTPHVDGGDFVIVTNASKLKVTGDKKLKKTYYRHTGFPGGIKSKTLQERLDENASDVIVDAVRGMLPANKLRDGKLARLKVYNGAEHNHAAQKPQKIDLKGNK